MALFLPPALSLKAFNGGYNSKLDTFLLGDNMTNDAKNVEIGSTIKKRNGYVRFKVQALCGNGVGTLGAVHSSTADRINGHYYFIKQAGEVEVEKHIVGAGKNIWQFASAVNSNTTRIVLSGLHDDADIQWNFAQVMNPNDGADDVVIGVNGYDKPIMWNGTDSSAVFLDSVAGASGVVPAKFIVSTKNRICLLHIKDDTDVDAGSKFILSGFDTAGTPTPHIFPTDLIAYAGGSDKYGPITGAVTLNGEIVIFKRNTIYIFTIGGGTTIDTETLSLLHDFSLRQINENVGCVAPKTIASIGNAVVFLSDVGVYMFDGVNSVCISEPIEKDIQATNNTRKSMATGIYNREKNQYWLSMTGKDSDYNDVMFVYDFNLKIWFAPYDDMRCDVLSNYRDGNKEKIICGDKWGYLYEMDKGTANGVERGYVLRKGQPDGYTYYYPNSRYVFLASSAPMSTTIGDKLRGISAYCLIGDKTEVAHVGTWNSVYNFFQLDRDIAGLDEASADILIAPIMSYYKTKDYDVGSPDLDKMFRSVNVRAKQFGNFNFNMNYVIDFNELSKAGSASISQYNYKYLLFDQITQTNSFYAVVDVQSNPNTIEVTDANLFPTAGSGLVGHVVQINMPPRRFTAEIVTATMDAVTINVGAYVNTSTHYSIFGPSGVTICGTVETVSVCATTLQLSAGTDLGTASKNYFWGMTLFNSGETHYRVISANTTNTLQYDVSGTNTSMTFGHDSSVDTIQIMRSWTIDSQTAIEPFAGCWGVGNWGPAPTKINAISLRFMEEQPLVGKFFALKFYNNNPNEPWEIYGIDIVAKTCGRR